jgi:hypothetical protein
MYRSVICDMYFWFVVRVQYFRVAVGLMSICVKRNRAWNGNQFGSRGVPL